MTSNIKSLCLKFDQLKHEQENKMKDSVAVIQKTTQKFAKEIRRMEEMDQFGQLKLQTLMEGLGDETKENEEDIEYQK